MKIFYLNRTVILTALLLLAISATASQPSINVVYPKEGSTIGAVDSTFIFGSVANADSLSINGNDVAIHKEGGFLVFLPIMPGKFEFVLKAKNKLDTTVYIRNVNVPEPQKTFDFDSLRIIDRSSVQGNLSLSSGDQLSIQLQGTPGCIARFSIPGYIDSVPMVEIEPQIQSFWGESVFGSGAVPDTMKIGGIYSSFIDIDNRILPDSAQIVFELKVPAYKQIIRDLIELPLAKLDMSRLKLLKFADSSIRIESGYFIKINSGEYPRYVQFTDTTQTIRSAPRKGYYSIFQPAGVKAKAVGESGDWVKLALSKTQVAWANKNSIKILKAGERPKRTYLSSVKINDLATAYEIELPLSEKVPFRVIEEDQNTLILDIFGITSDTDWIRYSDSYNDIALATWIQMEEDWYRLKVEFKSNIWGYDARYESNILKLYINKEPHDVARLHNKRIVVDPGHSPDPGAIGPTGLTEAEANLMIALELQKELEKRGAVVIMTRDDMSELPLYERPKIALEYNADLFVSIHNNALPDGVNPYTNNGVSTYYYHPHSIDLARSIQRRLVKALGLDDHGLYYGNLAVNRPTQYPAVLVECSFMMIPEQEANLKKKGYQKKIAKAIRKGIEDFLKSFNASD